MAEADSEPISILVTLRMEGYPSRFISANSNDTIKSVHYQIREVFGIPLTLQKIYYFGKRLEWCQTLKDAQLKTMLVSRATPSSGIIDVRDFKAFSLVLCNSTQLRVDSDLEHYSPFELTFYDLLRRMEAYLAHSENFSYMESAYCGYSQYLTILKALHMISKLRKSSEERFWNVLRNKRRSLLELIAKSTDRTNDHLWLLERKDVIVSKSRMHLAMMMMTEIRIHEVELYEMLVWSEKLDANLYMAFKNQQITNREVQQYWLRLLCRAIFNPQKSLFLACPYDPKRFYPNPAIELEPFHFDCLEFVGKLVALALMYEVRVGVAFARLFLWQLAGRRKISLENVKEVDPYLYSWCKKVIDAERIDSEVLEFAEAELGRQWSTELSHVNGKRSRQSYVDRLIQHRFVKSISNQLLFFRKGFDNVFGTSIDQLFSSNGLELEDLNESLRGRIISGTSQLNKRKFLNNDCNKSDTLMHRFQKVRRQGRNITNWQRGKLLGSGSFGSVYEGFAAEGFFFAVKELQLPDGGIIDLLEKEVDLLCQLTHPNIVKYFGTSKDESKLYVFLELVSKGSLEKVYKEFPLQDSHVSVYTKQILKGLNYLHERNVVHRDIKCANVLVDENGCVKIADFGLAKVTNSNAIIKSCKGTVCWMAPEVFKNNKAEGYGFQADIWSVGCTVLEMLTRKPPYSDLGLEKGGLIYRIGKGHLPSLPDSLSDDSRDFIQQCLKVNPKDRPTAAELLEHPFVNK
ncbi:hypothetical protein GH714_006706 [Hevea brasiliensis]|uniref:mitogen-activated protein kinase kinase kinase n=1 Tax=Hevea brasiliensis TaxID=3981 RepID=A0A6A6KYA1_HEVBR|nr:hypothetical protein GH714_006706 [Hevea brasiliensis]